MRSVNKVILMGYLGSDPTIKTVSNGVQVTNFTVATNREWNSNGENHQTADFHKIVAWRKLAETCAQFLKKGSAVYIEGYLANHNFKNKDGVEQKVTEIVADTINFISYSKGKDGNEVNLIEVTAN